MSAAPNAFRLHKVEVRLICTEHDADGDVVGEHMVAEAVFFAKSLDELPNMARETVADINAKRAEAQPTNRAERRARGKTSSRKKK